MKDASCSLHALVDRHFAKGIAPKEDRRLREHLARCDSCRARYSRHLLLSRLDPTAMSPKERLGRGLGLGEKPALIHRRAPVLAGLLVAAAALFVFVRTRAPADTEANGFAARGGLTAPTAKLDAGNKSRIEIHRVPKAGRPTPAGDVIHRDDELAFAYQNASGKPRLAIFGVDEHRRVYWFYPSWTNERETPVAIEVSRDANLHELPEAVAHRYDGARLDIHALFLDNGVTVREIEAKLGDGGSEISNIPGAEEEIRSFAVMP